MCCFAQPVESVSDTNLFARLTDQGTQFLIYQMKFKSQVANAMILPLPVKQQSGDQAVQFVSLKEYDDIFRDMQRAFPAPQPPRPLSRDKSIGAPASELVVHEVGDFIASYVPTLDDFARLNSKFVIPRATWEKIPEYVDYGFAVFQLKSNEGEPHPIAFEFQTRLADKVFFPTMHIHDGDVHPQEDFDHALYVQHPDFDRLCGGYVDHKTIDNHTQLVRSKDVAARYCRTGATQGIVESNLLLHRIEMRGKLENKDVVFGIADPLARKKASASQWLPVYLGIPGILGACGLAWIIQRRAKLQQ